SYAVLELVHTSSTAEDPNPPTAAKADLSIIDRGHPALALLGTDGAAPGFRLEARPMLLASLAKVYADPRFDQLVSARAVFKNITGAPVTDYRVRFRLTDFASDWSAWSGSAEMAPNQTVTTPYFPRLDEARLAQLQSFALADLQVEHEYRQV